MSAPAPGERALLWVRHRTTLRYAEPVVEARSEVRKTPIDTALQEVITTKLEVEPAVVVRAHVDYFGSCVRRFNILEPHSGVTVASESVVGTRSAVASGPPPDGDPRPWPQRLAEFLHTSPRVPDLPAYADVPNPVYSALGPDAFQEALLELSQTFRSCFVHDPSLTHVDSSPAELFEKGGGVCQDFAHAMLGVLRRGGVAARYVSGYVYDETKDDSSRSQAAVASHAWVQAWHPELGWVGIDPTFGRLVSWPYIQIAVGRDYSDVQPLRGVFVGASNQELDVAVEIRRIA